LPVTNDSLRIITKNSFKAKSTADQASRELDAIRKSVNKHELICYNFYRESAISLNKEFILESIEVARKTIEAASNKQAGNIALLDIRKICSFADYFVICTAESGRQIEAIAEEIITRSKKLGLYPCRTEGDAESGWMLLDIGEIIVHIFSPEQREHYNLDDLWSEASPVLRIQ
jgi:ribosome-associated protein